MNTEKKKNLNHLIRNWKHGIIYTQTYLSRIGYYSDLIKSYKRSGWLESAGRGAYKLPNDNVDWQGGLYTLQNQLGLPVHVGGHTSLELQGYGHYIRFAEGKCFLYGNPGMKLPKWFLDYDWGLEMKFKATNLFRSGLFGSLIKVPHKHFEILVSSRERAAMEMLYYVPHYQGFDEAMKIMESLMTLRFELVQRLLENCNQIKVKRLFLFMADELKLPFFEKLNLDGIELGKGKREIVKNGTFDGKYLITVPQTT